MNGDERTWSLTGDPRWKLLNGTDRRHMKALLTFRDPLTGCLETRALDLTRLLEVSEQTLRRSRLQLIKAGLIASYQPGTGHTASTYRIARSWEEAAENVARD